MNAQKLTQKSLEAVQAAQALATEYQNMQIEEQHLACALLSQQNGLIAQLLRKMNVDTDAMLAQLTCRWRSCPKSPAPAARWIKSMSPPT